jgi:hypothetical protein
VKKVFEIVEKKENQNYLRIIFLEQFQFKQDGIDVLNEEEE